MQRIFHFKLAGFCMIAELLCSLSWQASAAVFRCQATDGRVSYQDSICPGGAQGEAVDATPNRGFQFATKQQIDKAMRPPPDERLRPVRSGRFNARVATNAGERRFITSGVTAAEVRQRIGAPNHIAHPATSGGKRRNKDSTQRWVYLPAQDDPQTTTTLTLKGGLVTHVERRVTR